MISTTVDEETGEERKRLINRMRWKGYGPASIMFADVHVLPFLFVGMSKYLYLSRSQISLHKL